MINSHSEVANSAIVAERHENVDARASSVAQREKNIVTAKSTRSGPSIAPEVSTTAMPWSGGLLKDHGLSSKAAEQVRQSWRKSTRKQYNPYIKQWELYCSERQVDRISAPIECGVNFLSDLYQTGIGYSALNTARSALLPYIFLGNGISFGTHPLGCRVMK